MTAPSALLSPTHPASTRSTGAPRLSYIDTLRGLAATWVFVLHVHGFWLHDVRLTGLNLSRVAVFLAGLGSLGVDLFIVLSGFCLFHPLIRASEEIAPGFSPARFYRRRAYRLLPAYYAALALATVLTLIPSLRVLMVIRPIEWADVFSYTFLLQTFSQYRVGSINGSFWSIALEAQLYVVFPLLLALYARGRVRALIWAGLLTAFAWDFLLHPLGLAFDLNHHFPARWVEFIAGMVAARLVSHPPANLRRWSGWVCLLAMPLNIALHTGLTGRFRPPDPAITSMAAIAFGALVAWLSTVPEPIFASRRRLGWITKVGVISYSFYLLHQPILLLGAPLASKLRLGVVPTFVVALLTAYPLTLGLAYLFFIFIERPFLEHSKKPSEPVVSQNLPDRALP